jgi:hypothetical protein
MKKLTANTSLYYKIRYEMMILAGHCPRCNKPHKNNDFVLCEKCRIKNRNKKTDPIKRREYNKKHLQKLIANGLCTKCGNNPHADKKKLCQACLDKAAAYKAYKKAAHKKPAS